MKPSFLSRAAKPGEPPHMSKDIMRLSLPFSLLSSLRLSADSHESGLLAKKENPVHCLLTSILHSPAGMRGLSL